MSTKCAKFNAVCIRKYMNYRENISSSSIYNFGIMIYIYKVDKKSTYSLTNKNSIHSQHKSINTKTKQSGLEL